MRFVHFPKYEDISFLNSIHRMALVMDMQHASCKTRIKFIGAFWMNLWLKNIKNQALIACPE
jgi:hypothetical protein